MQKLYHERNGTDMQKRLEIGQIVNTFGIKGEIKVVPFTDDINRFDDLEKVYVKAKKDSKLYRVENARYHKNMVLLKLEGINNPEDAEMLKNAFLEVDREDAVPLKEGTYFIADLIGLDVYTDEGKLLGKVDDIYNTGANDIYVVKDELGKQILLPAISSVIKRVDLEEGEIIVDVSHICFLILRTVNCTYQMNMRVSCNYNKVLVNT